MRDTITSISDTEFFRNRMQINTVYFQSANVSNAEDIKRLAISLTNMDVLVQQFQSGQISESDILYHVFRGQERIVTTPGVYLSNSVFV